MNDYLRFLAQFISVLLDLTAELNELLQIPPGICQLFSIDGGSFDNWISDKAFDLADLSLKCNLETKG